MKAPRGELYFVRVADQLCARWDGRDGDGRPLIKTIWIGPEQARSLLAGGLETSGHFAVLRAPKDWDGTADALEVSA